MLPWMMAFFFSLTLWAEVSVTTYNIRNFGRENTNLKLLEEVLVDQSSDVMAFQEIVNTQSFQAWFIKKFPNYEIIFSSCGGGGQQKLALAYNKSVYKLLSQEEILSLSMGKNPNTCGSLRSGLMVSLNHKLEKQNYSFLSLHLKAGSQANAIKRREEQYKILKNLILKSANQMIILGDLNTTGFITQNQDYASFRKLLNDLNLRTSGDEIGCTSYWKPSGNSKLQSSILDHILYSDRKGLNLVEVSTHCFKHHCKDTTEESIGKTYHEVSDHCPIKLTIR